MASAKVAAITLGIMSSQEHSVLRIERVLSAADSQAHSVFYASALGDESESSKSFLNRESVNSDNLLR